MRRMKGGPEYIFVDLTAVLVRLAAARSLLVEDQVRMGEDLLLDREIVW